MLRRVIQSQFHTLLLARASKRSVKASDKSQVLVVLVGADSQKATEKTNLYVVIWGRFY